MTIWLTFSSKYYNIKRSVLISKKRSGFNPGHPQQARDPHSSGPVTASGFDSDGHKCGRDQRAGTGAPQSCGRADRFMQVKSPWGPRVWPYRACQPTLINHHKQRGTHAHQEKQSNLPDTELETGAEPIHTFLNRTSHHECRHFLLPAAIPTSRRPPCRASITGQASFVLVDGWVVILLPGSSPPYVTKWTPETGTGPF